MIIAAGIDAGTCAIKDVVVDNSQEVATESTEGVETVRS